MREVLDRFARRELSPAESRNLAQEALGNHELFDELTARAIAKRQPIGWPRIAIFTAAGAGIVAAVALYSPRPNAQPFEPVTAAVAPPILLARNADSNPAAFRGVDAASREPRVTGSIGAIADGVATIDLGSLDGLSKGAEVDVMRDGQTIGRVKLTAVFRDHSRGEIEGRPSIAVKDRVRVPPPARLRAVLDRIAAALARGETERAAGIAQQASIETFDGELDGDGDLNNAGAIAELSGNRNKAGEFYRRALQARPSVQDRRAIEKNLARLESVK